MSRIAQLEKLHAADPGDADVMYMMAQEHAKEARWDEAVSWYDRCLGADPAYLYAYFHKARALESGERIDEALATLRAGLAKARGAGDAKATNEIASYLDQLEP